MPDQRFAEILLENPHVRFFDSRQRGYVAIELTRDHHKLGVTILLVEHNAVMALEIAHRAYVLQSGEVVLQGSGPELINTDAVREAYLG